MILRVAGVGKSFGRRRALVDVSLSFGAGEVTALLGPNGAGKTSLLGILSTLVKPTRGEVLLEQQAQSQRPAREAIGYVGHEPGVYPDLSARQNLRLFAALYDIADGEAKVAAMLERVGLGEVQAELPARAFSRGMLQRLALARALLPAPQILLFDEPSSALDPEGVDWLTDELARERQAGRLVVIATHDLEAAARVSSHIVVLHRGRVAAERTEPNGFSAAQVRAIYQDALTPAESRRG
ncbi:MAG: heme ABC exporter ATP-binding protein CcmA [Polyangia bacterium]|jgi:heme exporter protein A